MYRMEWLPRGQWLPRGSCDVFFFIVSVTSERDHRKCQHHLKTPKTSPRATAMAALKTLDLFPPPAAGQIFPQPGT